MLKFLRLFFVFLLFISGPVGGFSANAANLASTAEFNKLSKSLSTIENSLKNGKIQASETESYISYLSDLSTELSTVKRDNERELKVVQKQLEALGEEPDDGTKELDSVSKKRKELKNELTVHKSLIAETDVLQVRIDELNISLFNLKNHEIINSLVTKQSVLINPANFLGGMSAFAVFLWDVARSPLIWYQGLAPEAQSKVLSYFIPVIFILIGAFWIGFVLKKGILKKWLNVQDQTNFRYGQKILAAVFVTLARGIAPALIIGGLIAWMVGTELFTSGLFPRVSYAFLLYVLFVFFSRALILAVFEPGKPGWRLINVSNEKAKGISRALLLSAILIGAVSVLEKIAFESEYSRDLYNFLLMISCAVKAFSIILLTTKIFSDEPEDQSLEQENDEKDSTSFKIILITSFVVLATFLISVFGYPDLSVYIMNRYILTALIVCIFMIVHSFLKEVLKRILLAGFWGKAFRGRQKLLLKVKFVLSMVLTPILTLIFLFIILNLWGFSDELLLHIGKKLLFGFEVGSFKISLIAIALGVVVFFGTLALVKMFKTNLTINILSKLDIDDGIKHSLSSVIGFIGFILAAVFGIIVMGGDLTNLAVIAGALSVGIGFGLQNVINNFVSGIIILFERPFKVGDWVIFNGDEGVVKQINIRSTEIETFQKTSVLVPNATLLSSSLTNLTHGNTLTRQTVKVGVAYGSDVEKVTQILLECATNNKKVLKTPAPSVVFQDFGESSLNFDLRCYSNNIWVGWSIPSELRYEILKRFTEEGIEIPFKQLVVRQPCSTDDKSRDITKTQD